MCLLIRIYVYMYIHMLLGFVDMRLTFPPPLITSNVGDVLWGGLLLGYTVAIWLKYTC